jgi:hypothetical protein
METIAVFVNDARHAQQVLEPLLQRRPPTHWILVACAPHLKRHVGRWLTQAARAQWRERWAAALFAELEPPLRALAGGRVDKRLAQRPLLELTSRLQAQHPDVQLLDARAPRWGHADEPIGAGQPTGPRWLGPLAVTTGLSAMLALAD